MHQKDSHLPRNAQLKKREKNKDLGYGTLASALWRKMRSLFLFFAFALLSPL